MCREGAGSVAQSGGEVRFICKGGVPVYQALYRKYRPRTFSEVVGQQHITDTLQRQVADGQVGHAYLFTGTRGTGKTTCARILAKAVNCENPIDGAPCNQCAACRGIDDGSLLDVTELDAASNGSVSDARSLREEAIYPPSVLRKRVYIIDEVHMLSKDAFNALLKIMEEPPEHLLFILATTELQKVPATILSRCQRFSFKRILPQDIARQLLHIAGEENIDLTPDGANILARMANGAMRDALSLLDQCRSFEGTLNAPAILELLGLAGGVQAAQLMEFILRRNTQDTLLLFDKLYRDGKDIAALLRELSDLGRDLLIRCSAPQGGSALLTGLYDEMTLENLSVLASGQRLLFMLDTLAQALAALASNGSLRTEAELCLMKLCDETLCGDLAALNARMERLERAAAKGFTPMQPLAAKVEKAAVVLEKPLAVPAEKPISNAEKPISDAEKAASQADEAPTAPQPEPPKAPVENAPPPAPAKPAPTGHGDIWQRLQDRYKGALRIDKRVFLNGASGTLADGVLTVTCRDDMVKNYLDCPEVVEVLERVTSEEAGCPVRVVFVLGEVKAAAKQVMKRPAAPEKPAPQQAPQAAPERREPEQTPPWESATAGSDPMNELLAEGSRLDNFNIK